MVTPFDSLVVRTACRLLIPFMQLFALYVVFHGHESPGGGFQGGAIFGASFILTRFTQGSRVATRLSPGDRPLQLGAVGVLVFAGVGLLPLAWGGEFLDYGRVAVPGMDAAHVRHLGILGIELGVAVAVTGVMLAIFDELAPGGGS